MNKTIIPTTVSQILAIALAASISTSAWTQEAENLIKNPSFEGTGQAMDGAKPWAGNVRGATDGQYEGVSFEIVDGEAQEGTRAAKIEVAPHTHLETLADWSQLVPVKPGTRYYFSIYAKAEIQTGWMSIVVDERLKNRTHADDGSSRGFAHLAKAQESDAPKTGYRLFETTFETGPETFFVAVSLRIQPSRDNKAGGTVLFDNASLIER